MYHETLKIAKLPDTGEQFAIDTEKDLPQRHKDTEVHQDIFLIFGGSPPKIKIIPLCPFVSWCLGGESFLRPR
jgi:hypothetical protein